MRKGTQKIFLRQPTVCKNDLEEQSRIKKVFKKQYISSYIKYNNGVEIIDGTALYRRMLAQKYAVSETINGIFFEWDNTPRHAERGYIITPPERTIFEQYLDQISDQEYVFINAWNEWAEGIMLEPTEENGYKYLEWIKERVDRNDGKNS